VEVEECPCEMGVGNTVDTYVVFTNNLHRNGRLCASYLKDLM